MILGDCDNSFFEGGWEGGLNQGDKEEETAPELQESHSGWRDPYL